MTVSPLERSAGRAGIPIYLTMATSFDATDVLSARLMCRTREGTIEWAVTIDAQALASITLLHTTTTTSLPSAWDRYEVDAYFYDGAGGTGTLLGSSKETLLPRVTAPLVALPT